MTALYCLASAIGGAGLALIGLAILTAGSRADDWSEVWNAGYEAGKADAMEAVWSGEP